MEQLIYVDAEDVKSLVPDEAYLGLGWGDAADLLDVISSKYKIGPRDELEEDSTKKQLVVYILLEQDFSEKTFVTQRLSKQSEGRLHGLYSLGIGGHVNEGDASVSGDFLFRAAMRELYEEVKPIQLRSLQHIGFVNNNANHVGQVHLGVVYRATLTDVVVKETEKTEGEWVRPEKMPVNKMERWSQLIYRDCFDPSVSPFDVP